MSQSPFVKKVVKGTFWLTFGSVMAKGLTALAYLVLARILTVNAYGEYGMVKSTIDNFLIFATMGVGLTATKYISELKDENKQKASSILGASIVAVTLLSSVVFLVLILFSNSLATSVLGNEALRLPLILAGGVLLFISVNGVVGGALLGLQSYRSMSVINSVQGVLLFVFLCLGGYFYGMVGAVAGNLVAMILMCLISWYILRSTLKEIGMKISLKNLKESLRSIYKFAIPASLGMLVVAPTIWILNTMLVNTPDGYTQLGVYTAVLIFSLAIRTVNGSLSNALLPIFLSKDMEITPKKEFFNYHGAWILCLLISIPFIIFPEIATYILGAKYPEQDVILILELSIITTFLISFKQGIHRDLIKKNRMWLSVLSTGIFASTAIIVFLLLKDYGALGFAISFLAGYFMNTVLVIPLFVYLKVTPKNTFRSFWILLVVGLVGLLAYNAIYTQLIILRSLVSLIGLVLLLFCVYKFYKKMISLKVSE
ncbi:oligosaccharide flippase family protein [Rasiella rasia]|uniref:Oligosaccharide flippase family protein n=1 Tax=Rasiella rasia TaxID=2744027 RepID=A0A6G6GI91_9FLAO|nr:oligosaccharide flippase family protein [Rasiella rasia]QIE58262.1 oligosaccharide flippase family protein [Rasiella rasia]